MRNKLGMFIGISALMVGPAMAQNAPNPNQVAAKALLQAADARATVQECMDALADVFGRFRPSASW